MKNIIKIHNKRLSNKYLFIIIVVLFVVALSTFLFVRYKNDLIDLISNKKLTSKEIKASYDDAYKASSVGDYDKGQSILDEALKGVDERSDQSNIYIQKSALALNNSKNDQSVEYALNAENLDPSRLTATVLAVTYEAIGNKELALKYYKLVVERTTQEERMMAPAEYERYQNKIKELGD